MTKTQRRNLVHTLRFYLFLRRDPARTNGHNPLAGMAYVALYFLFIVTILTGLGLFAWVLRTPPWTTLFGWTYSVMPVPELRLVHFLLMFLYIGFAIHHVYSAVLYDIEERHGEISSIITGYKLDVLDDGNPPGVQPREQHVNGAADTVVIGLGNVILSDDGLGVHAVRRLRERYVLGEEVELIEGGTAGLLLLPHLADARRAILVDAIDSGAPAGTLVRPSGRRTGRRVHDIRMTPHDVGLADLLGVCVAERSASRGACVARRSARLDSRRHRADHCGRGGPRSARGCDRGRVGPMGRAHAQRDRSGAGAPLESQPCV